ncbi:hypothetical protein FHETE_4467 [Fusarium heterosporum]|uniref:Uncharacterized protein n=1 Tax=Fusarium heterosporum TaxID=42747 RepID=A0A8H5TJM9_FUSHE|nr:hypothetical protein FHETE_4467 [Fusarium heterosporum]
MIIDQSQRMSMEDRNNSPSVNAYTADELNPPKYIQHYEPQMDEVKAELDDIWLQMQLFWDLMLRMQPNCITLNAEYTGQAVAYLLDFSVARLFLDTRPDSDPTKAWLEAKDFRRRLRRLELLLRTDMTNCGNAASMLCVCMVTARHPKHKSNIWNRVFGNRKKEEAGHGEHRIYRLRDIALLMRLEDFLTHKAVDFNRQLKTCNPQNVSVLVHTAIESMEDEIKMCLINQGHVTVDDLKDGWMGVLSNPFFRAGVVHEVINIVDDALKFRKKYGTSAHQEGCEFEASKSNLVRRLTSR